MLGKKNSSQTRPLHRPLCILHLTETITKIHYAYKCPKEDAMYMTQEQVGILAEMT